MKQPSSTHRNQLLRRPKRQRRQQQLLEVSLRADKEREKQFKFAISVLFKLILFCGLGVGAWVGTKQAMRRLVWENRVFYLTDVHVTTDGTLTREQILNTGGVVEGRNIFLLDLAKVRRTLDDLPQVERVEVQRTLPNRIDVQVTERQPVAWIAAPGDTDPIASERSYLIDGRGYVMQTRKLLPDYYSLPTITGVEPGNIVAGKRITAPVAPGSRQPDGRVAVLRQEVTAAAVQAALDLIKLNSDPRWQVRNIDVSKQYCLVVTDQSHALITFALDNLEKQLSRLYRLLDAIEPTHKEIQTVNLLVEHNIPVTFVEPPTEAFGAPAEAVPGPKPDSGKPALGKDKTSKDKAAGTSPAPVRRAKSKDPESSGLKRTGVEALKKPFRP